MSTLVTCKSSSRTVFLFLIFLFFPTLAPSTFSIDSTMSSDCCCGIIDSSASVLWLVRHFLTNMISRATPAKIMRIHNSRYCSHRVLPTLPSSQTVQVPSLKHREHPLTHSLHSLSSV